VKFYCIADEDTVRGFRLAGVEGRAVKTLREAQTALKDAQQDAEVGILILTERVATDLRHRVDKIRLTPDRPLVVQIPGPEGPISSRKTHRQLVQEAIGVRTGQQEGA
jgi:V/A-type H+-transporting ATPase subunit F